MRYLSALKGGLAVATALASPLAAQQVPVQATPDDYIAGYNAALARTVDLPVAPPTAELAPATTLTRIAFGSCNRQDASQAIWATIAATDPQAFLLIGDNVYGDVGWNGGADLGSLRAAYAAQATHPEFSAFRAAVPMMTVWDDHDYGWNDGGASFAFRQWAQEIYRHFWNVPADIRAHDGVYFAREYGEAGQRVQLIMLDTRFFRSDLRRPQPGEEGPEIGRYLPQNAPDATMLGDAQWQWLEEQLRRPADLRLVVSSVQVLTTAYGWEGWGLMPRERARLLDMLDKRAGGGAVLLSGDRHAAGIYRADGTVEITASSLNAPAGTTEQMTEREPDPARVTPFFGEANFGLIDIDWRARTVSLRVMGDKGEERATGTMAF